MGRIIVFDNLLDPMDNRQFNHAGPLIDFLLEQFPAGFEGEHVIVLNGDKLPVAEYDRPLRSQDFVAIVQFPGPPVAAWYALQSLFVKALVNVAISLALNYAISFFTGKTASPSYTKSSLPSADTVYTFSGSANSARIGEIIPVAYGRNLLSPDLAMAPYTYYWDNQQYLILLNCLGQGEFYIHDILMAGNSINDLGSDVITVDVYPPGRHKSQFGLIQSETGRYENVYTSPAVSDQTLEAPPIGGGGGSGWTAYARSGTVSIHDDDYEEGDRSGYKGGSLSVVDGYYEDPNFREVFNRLINGQPVYASVNGSTYRLHNRRTLFNWSSDYPLTFILETTGAYDPPGCGEEPFDPEDDCWNLCANWPAEIRNTVVNVTFQYTPEEEEEEGGKKVGDFIAVPIGHKTTTLMYDLVYPGGVYKQDPETGNILSDTVQTRFTATNLATDQTYVLPVTHTFATTTPQRVTVWHTVPEGRYKVRACRLSTESTKSYDQSKVTWAGLKAVLGNPEGGEVYGHVTLLSVAIKATEGLASNAHSAMTVDCNRTQFGYDTHNPAVAFVDILKNPFYGANRPDSEIDFETIGPLTDAWNAAERRFDAVFDNETTVWDALKLSLQMQAAMPITLGAKLSIVEDKSHDLPEVILDTSQIKTLVLSYSFVATDDYDGIEGKYKNSKDNADEYVYWPSDCVNPEEMTLWGCKTKADALAFVKTTWKKRRYRRQLFTLELEGDGHALYLGQCIGLKHPLVGEEEATRAIISSITAGSEFETTVEGFIYRDEVFQ